MSNSVMSLYNRIDIPQLECHFKWFNALNNEFNGKWLRELMNKNLHKDLEKHFDTSDGLDDPAAEDHTDDPNEILTLTSNRLGQLSWRFTLLLRNVFEKNFSEAFELSKELLILNEALNPSQPQAHIDTFAYIGLANQLNILKEWHLFNEMSSLNDNEAVTIMEKIEALHNSVDSNEGKAFVMAMKSNLARDMMDSKLRIDFAKKATELNSQCASWQQTLFFALRNHRRTTDFRQKMSQLEIDAGEKAFELEMTGQPESITMDSIVAMSMLYRELLFTCHRGGPEHQEITERAINFARETVRLKPHSVNMKIRLASLLSSRFIYRRYPKDGYQEALELYKECEVGSVSSEVCHKLGKFYDNRKNPEYNSNKALQWFGKGLEANIGNFPCFADMLRNPVFRSKSTAAIIEKIDNILSFQSKRSFKCQLMFIKGFFLWANNSEASLQWWLMAVEEAAEVKVNFVSLATFNFCYIRDGNGSQALRMMRLVKFYMKRQEGTHSGNENFSKLTHIVDSVIEHFSSSNYF